MNNLLHLVALIFLIIYLLFFIIHLLRVIRNIKNNQIEFNQKATDDLDVYEHLRRMYKDFLENGQVKLVGGNKNDLDDERSREFVFVFQTLFSIIAMLFLGFICYLMFRDAWAFAYASCGIGIISLVMLLAFSKAGGKNIVDTFVLRRDVLEIKLLGKRMRTTETPPITYKLSDTVITGYFYLTGDIDDVTYSTHYNLCINNNGKKLKFVIILGDLQKDYFKAFIGLINALKQDKDVDKMTNEEIDDLIKEGFKK